MHYVIIIIYKGGKMKINTKYNSGDRVWYYIKEYNSYIWGKIESIDISVRCGVVDVVSYNVRNRIYKPDSYKFIKYDGRYVPEDHEYVTIQEQEAFNSVEELRKFLEQAHRDKMDSLSEMKRGWFN